MPSDNDYNTDRAECPRVKTSALFFPFDLFGSGGTKAGVRNVGRRL